MNHPPKWAPGPKPTTVLFTKIGNKSFENEMGHYWIYTILVSGETRTLFVNPRLQSLFLSRGGLQENDVVAMKEVPNISEKTGKPFKSIQVHFKDGSLLDTANFFETPRDTEEVPEEPPLQADSAPNGVLPAEEEWPPFPGEGESLPKVENIPPAPSVKPPKENPVRVPIEDHRLDEVYVHAMVSAARVLENEKAKAIMENYGFSWDRETFLSLATHLSITLTRCGLFRPPGAPQTQPQPAVPENGRGGSLEEDDEGLPF